MDDGRTWTGHGQTIPQSKLDTKMSVRCRTKKNTFFQQQIKIEKKNNLAEKKEKKMVSS